MLRWLLAPTKELPAEDPDAGSQPRRLPTPPDPRPEQLPLARAERGAADRDRMKRSSSASVAPLHTARGPPNEHPGTGSRRHRLPTPADLRPHRLHKQLPTDRRVPVAPCRTRGHRSFAAAGSPRHAPDHEPDNPGDGVGNRRHRLPTPPRGIGEHGKGPRQSPTSALAVLRWPLARSKEPPEKDPEPGSRPRRLPAPPGLRPERLPLAHTERGAVPLRSGPRWDPARAAAALRWLLAWSGEPPEAAFTACPRSRKSASSTSCSVLITRRNGVGERLVEVG
ncbi:hypothetical protein KPATCC21470_5419 [Kitasatospora purpeofusca]